MTASNFSRLNIFSMPARSTMSSLSKVKVLVSGETLEARLLERDVVVVVHVVDAVHAVATRQQPQGQCGTDKSGDAGDHDFHGYSFRYWIFGKCFRAAVAPLQTAFNWDAAV